MACCFCYRFFLILVGLISLILFIINSILSQKFSAFFQLLKFSTNSVLASILLDGRNDRLMRLVRGHVTSESSSEVLRCFRNLCNLHPTPCSLFGMDKRGIFRENIFIIHGVFIVEKEENLSTAYGERR